jgi:hypothetical protein
MVGIDHCLLSALSQNPQLTPSLQSPMTDLDSCSVGDVSVSFDGGGVLEFRSASPSGIGSMCVERKALLHLRRVRRMFSLSNCLICEPTGGLSFDDDGRTVLRMLLPHESQSWLPLHHVEASIRSKVLSIVADQLCDWHSAGIIHRTMSPNCILVDPSPPSSANFAGPAVVILHWACCTIFDAASKAFVNLSNSPHRVPFYAAPERLRWADASPISPCEDFYGLGMIVKEYLSPDKAGPVNGFSTKIKNPLKADELWHLHVSNNPVSTVLDHILQPDCLLRAFRPIALQTLIELHGSEVFASPCKSLFEQNELNYISGLNAALSSSPSQIAADSDVASLSWIESCVHDLVDGKCVKALVIGEVLKLIVLGVTVRRDIIQFLRKLIRDRVLIRLTPWFVFVDLDALKQCEAFVEKSTVLMRVYDSMNPTMQSVMLHLAACPYFVPFHKLLAIAQV